MRRRICTYILLFLCLLLLPACARLSSNNAISDTSVPLPVEVTTPETTTSPETTAKPPETLSQETLGAATMSGHYSFDRHAEEIVMLGVPYQIMEKTVTKACIDSYLGLIPVENSFRPGMAYAMLDIPTESCIVLDYYGDGRYLICYYNPALWNNELETQVMALPSP